MIWGPYFLLRTACLFSYGENKYFQVCNITILEILKFRLWISSPKLHKAHLSSSKISLSRKLVGKTVSMWPSLVRKPLYLKCHLKVSTRSIETHRHTELKWQKSQQPRTCCDRVINGFAWWNRQDSGHCTLRINFRYGIALMRCIDWSLSLPCGSSVMLKH